MSSLFDTLVTVHIKAVLYCGDLLPAMVARADASLSKLNQALTVLSQLRPLQKPVLLNALARCVEHDGVITTTEAELFRAVADALDCPMPPLLTV